MAGSISLLHTGCREVVGVTNLRLMQLAFCHHEGQVCAVLFEVDVHELFVMWNVALIYIPSIVSGQERLEAHNGSLQSSALDVKQGQTINSGAKCLSFFYIHFSFVILMRKKTHFPHLQHIFIIFLHACQS